MPARGGVRDPPHLSPRRKRWGSAALAAAVLGTSLIAATATNPAAGAEPTNPTLELVAPDKVTAYTYGGGVYSDLGFRLEVEDAPLEIWSQRAADYKSLPTAVASFPLGDVVLPEQQQVGQLNRFISLRIVDHNNPGAAPIVRFRSTCLGETAERMDPDSDFKNPYPRTCYYNSFALGSVSGIRRLGGQRLRLRHTAASQARRLHPDRVGHPGVRRRARLVPGGALRHHRCSHRRQGG